MSERRPLSVLSSGHAPLIAGAVLLAAAAAVPSGRPDPLSPGTRVRYSEDRDGYAWFVVQEAESGRYEVQRPSPYGDHVCVAEARELAPLPHEPAMSRRPASGRAHRP